MNKKRAGCAAGGGRDELAVVGVGRYDNPRAARNMIERMIENIPYTNEINPASGSR
jgi:hypothetical protein